MTIHTFAKFGWNPFSSSQVTTVTKIYCAYMGGRTHAHLDRKPENIIPPAHLAERVKKKKKKNIFTNISLLTKKPLLHEETKPMNAMK